MNDDATNPESRIPNPELPSDFPDKKTAFRELMALYRERNVFQRFRAMVSGLRRPRDTREYKMARIELQRLAAPAAAFLIPLLLVAFLAILPSGKKELVVDFTTTIMEPDTTKEPPLDPVTPEPPEPVTEPVNFPSTIVTFEPFNPISTDAPSPEAPSSIQSEPLPSYVTPHKAPVILKGIFAETRGISAIRAGLARFGGNKKTEAAVIRSLRWLKSVQNEDGSWPQNKVAMTGLAILAFLAHGEIPGHSPEFGETVQKGIQFLLDHQREDGLFTIRDANNYSHPIATYALCEAFGMTRNPNIRDAADKALDHIVRGQHPSGGWDYNMRQSERDDTSYMGWCAQALKAAQMADFYHDPEALERASRLSVRGFKKNGFQDGGFGYTGPQKGGLTGVGTLCLQFHHAESDPYVKNSLANIIYGWLPEWTGYSPLRAARGDKLEAPSDLSDRVVSGGSKQYYYYYATQAVFQNGGEKWDRWNARMWPSYVAAQFVVPAGEVGASCTCGAAGGRCLCHGLKEPYRDAEGNYREIGHWINVDSSTDRPVMDTCLAALQMMVYYRYLPTFQKIDIPAEVVASSTEATDIAVESDL
jgi:hypothetical protein